MARTSGNTSKPVKVLSYALTFLGIAVLIMFIIPLFSGTLNTGSYFGFVIGAVTLLMGIFTPKLFDNGKKAVRYIFRTVLIIYAALVAYAVILSAFMIANMNDAPEKDGSRTVIVLGCQVRRDGPSLMLSRRIDAAYNYLSEDEKADCIVSGGKGDNEHISEAEAMYEVLVNDGIAQSRITKEDKSSSTYENLLFSKQILEDNGKPLRIAVVTDGFHQWRARLQAEGLGYDVKCVSAATPWYLIPVYWVREWFALSYLFVFGTQ
mgnify:CR=1 FL=1